jgi:hypothetical protein
MATEVTSRATHVAAASVSASATVGGAASAAEAPAAASGKASRPAPESKSQGKRAARPAPVETPAVEQLAQPSIDAWQALIADADDGWEQWDESWAGATSSAAHQADGEWEMPNTRRSARKSGSLAAAPSSDEVSLTHLTHLKSSVGTSLSSKGDVKLHSDECQLSDETTLLNDEDWSSAGSTSEAADGTLPTKAVACKERPGSAQGLPSGTWPSRKTSSKGTSPKMAGAKPVPSKAVEAKAARPRGIKELNDATLLEPKGWGAASMLASIDLDLIVSLASRGADALKQRALVVHEALLRRTPRTRALVQAHGADRGVQAAMVVVALLLLFCLQSLQQMAEPMLAYAYVPQAVSMSHWLEIPFALLLGLRCSDLGAKLWTVCAPVPLPQSRCDRPSQ